MNEKDMLNVLISYLERAVNFTIANAPDVLQRYVEYQTSLNLAIVICGFFLGCISLFFAIKSIKSIEEARYELEGAYFVAGVMLAAFSLCAFGAFFISICELIPMYLNPEGWLISKFLK